MATTMGEVHYERGMENTVVDAQTLAFLSTRNDPGPPAHVSFALVV